MRLINARCLEDGLTQCRNLIKCWMLTMQRKYSKAPKKSVNYYKPWDQQMLCTSHPIIPPISFSHLSVRHCTRHRGDWGKETKSGPHRTSSSIIFIMFLNWYSPGWWFAINVGFLIHVYIPVFLPSLYFILFYLHHFIFLLFSYLLFHIILHYWIYLEMVNLKISTIFLNAT